MSTMLDALRPGGAPPVETPPGPLLGELECPECAEGDVKREFETKQGLALHRSKTHGVKSATRSAAAKKKTRKTRPQKAKQPARLDQNAILRAVFPTGVPADVSTLARASAWLSEAESLFKG